MKAIGPGDLVRCVVESTDHCPDRIPNLPKVGSVYTVRGFDPLPLPSSVPRGIFLMEVINPPAQWSNGFGEGAFDPNRFVPIDDGEIQIFRDLVANPHEKVIA